MSPLESQRVPWTKGETPRSKVEPPTKSSPEETSLHRRRSLGTGVGDGRGTTRLRFRDRRDGRTGPVRRVGAPFDSGHLTCGTTVVTRYHSVGVVTQKRNQPLGEREGPSPRPLHTNKSKPLLALRVKCLFLRLRVVPTDVSSAYFTTLRLGSDEVQGLESWSLQSPRLLSNTDSQWSTTCFPLTVLHLLLGPHVRPPWDTVEVPVVTRWVGRYGTSFHLEHTGVKRNNH